MQLVILFAVLNFVTRIYSFFSSSEERKYKKLKRQMDMLKFEVYAKEKDIDLSQYLVNEPKLSIANSFSASPIFKIVFSLGLGIISFAVILFTICLVIG